MNEFAPDVLAELPIAVDDWPLAFVATPMAVDDTPLAFVKKPIAVDNCPVAEVPNPIAMEGRSLADAPSPIAMRYCSPSYFHKMQHFLQLRCHRSQSLPILSLP